MLTLQTSPRSIHILRDQRAALSSPLLATQTGANIATINTLSDITCMFFTLFSTEQMVQTNPTTNCAPELIRAELAHLWKCQAPSEKY